ncbi:hypothetical protein X801_02036 [Opisthorchis viverrini]|uniref:Uncharacterized protein n=1 Tax=Opisthorchis viverrini TaxID=6198 RepID=A0A1S8X5Q5_OPIVI|nr:hypothetical protein X801_02036 [Opisthorchis viverrini]
MFFSARSLSMILEDGLQPCCYNTRSSHYKEFVDQTVTGMRRSLKTIKGFAKNEEIMFKLLTCYLKYLVAHFLLHPNSVKESWIAQDVGRCSMCITAFYWEINGSACKASYNSTRRSPGCCEDGITCYLMNQSKIRSNDKCFWTDSLITLRYICAVSLRLKAFVFNRTSFMH